MTKEQIENAYLMISEIEGGAKKSGVEYGNTYKMITGNIFKGYNCAPCVKQANRAMLTLLPKMTCSDCIPEVIIEDIKVEKIEKQKNGRGKTRKV